MKKYKFLIGWFNGSDGACGEETGVNGRDDLVKLYKAGSEHVTCYEYEAPEEFAWEVGASKAFRDNFTAHDTCSIVVDADELPRKWYWVVGPTAVEEFDSLDAAASSLDMLLSLPGNKYTFRIGEKETSVDKSEIAIVHELEG